MSNNLQKYKVLLLNKNWVPLGIISLKKAISLITKTEKDGSPKAKILDAHSDFSLFSWEDWSNLIADEDESVIRSANKAYKIPNIILLTTCTKMPNLNRTKFNRRAIYRRDNDQCFPGNTLILMSTGALKQISAIHTGDEIIDAEGNIQKVVNVFSKKLESNENLLEFKLKNNDLKIQCTKEHKLISFDKQGNYDLNGLNADKFSKNHNLAELVLNKNYLKPIKALNGRILDLSMFINDYRHIIRFDPHKNSKIDCSFSLGVYAGYILAKAQNINSNEIVFSFDKDDTKLALYKDYTKEMYEELKKIFTLQKCNYNIFETKNKVICRIFSSKLLASVFRKLCYYNSIKSFPYKNFNIEFLKGILCGVMRLNGKWNFDNNTSSFSVENKILLLDLYNISLMIGLIPKLNLENKELVFNVANFELNLALSYEIKNDKNKNGNYIVNEIEDIKEVEYNDLVYDLEVTGSHTYIANGIVVHNCQFCQGRPGKSYLSLDHVIPRSQGGLTTWENIVLACVDCNSKKANRTPEQAGMKLIRQPTKPSFKLYKHECYYDSWKKLLGEMYWEVELENDNKN